MTTIYTVETLRSGQPRAYADTVNEYLITVARSVDWGPEKGTMKPAGYAVGNLERAKLTVRALCQNFRERGDQDGRTAMGAHFFPTLEMITVDEKAGTIRAIIREAFTD